MSQKLTSVSPSINYTEIVGEYGDYNDLSTSIDFTIWIEYFTAGLIGKLLSVNKLLPTNTPNTKLEVYHLKIIEYCK